jgi:hypothetical protein
VLGPERWGAVLAVCTLPRCPTTTSETVLHYKAAFRPEYDGLVTGIGRPVPARFTHRAILGHMLVAIGRSAVQVTKWGAAPAASQYG